MIITKDIDFGKGLTEEQLRMLAEAEAAPAVPDEDSPDLTDEQFIRFSRSAGAQRHGGKASTANVRPAAGRSSGTQKTAGTSRRMPS